MSFTGSKTGSTFNNGFFLLDEEDSLRETALISKNHTQAVTRENRKIVPMGAVVPSNDGNAIGLLYEDIDVTEDDALGSVVTRGKVYEDRLPASVESAAKAVLTGLQFVTSPNVVRPSIFAKFAKLAVASVAGSSSGKTAITVTGYTLKAGESLVYKTDASAAPTVDADTDLTSWTSWNGTDQLTATTGHKITVVAKGADGKAIGAGSTSITSAA